MRITLVLIAALVLAACAPKPAATVAPTPAVVASPIASPAPPLTTLGDEDCMRGEAIAVLDPSRVSSHLFRRGMGPRAEETAVLAGGVSVRIQHLGCEHFVERYAFVVPGEVAPAASLTRLGELLKSLPVREGRAVNMSHWSELLAARAAVSPPLGVNTGEEIVVVPDFSWLSVNVKPVPGGKTELELVYDIAL